MEIMFGTLSSRPAFGSGPRQAGMPAWLRGQPEMVRNWIAACAFQPKPGTHYLVPGPQGELARVLVGLEPGIDRWSMAGLPVALPAGAYRLDPDTTPGDAFGAAFAWAMGGYAFTRYRSDKRKLARLIWPVDVDRAEIRRLASAIALARDLINTPAEDMGPADLAAAARGLARSHGARISVIVGDELTTELSRDPCGGSGQFATAAPYRSQMGPASPALTLVGKGVCFDSGGLDLKSGSAMKLMKKDMGGAALMLGLAQAIMSSELRLRLRLLVPAVENSVSGNAYRPLDVISTRKGHSVEIGNTDAEGRVILCDALAEADSEKPDLIIDAATLTGAARVALGTDLPALFATDDELADLLLRHGRSEGDPLWRLPLHQGYRRMLDSKVADINNVSDAPYGGAITAALYLNEFVSPGAKWMHIDTMAWNLKDQPGRPEGGEAHCLRALLAFVRDWSRPRPAAAVKVLPAKPAPRPSPARRGRSLRR
jgi:leucyl aminopeptidase